MQSCERGASAQLLYSTVTSPKGIADILYQDRVRTQTRPDGSIPIKGSNTLQGMIGGIVE